MTIVKYSKHLPLALLGMTPFVAHAQAVPDIERSITQGSQIDDVIRDQEILGDQLNEPKNEIDGEAGIYVLTKNDIFFAGASAGIGYSGNPMRTVDDVGGSFSTDFAATIGVQTKFAETIDFGARVSFSGVEYGEAIAPSSRNVNGAISAGTAIEGTPLYLGVTAFGGFNFDRGFENGTAFYGASASASAGLPLGRKTAIRPGIGATRQWSETEENNSTSASGSVEILHAITQQLIISANARVTRTWFDNFFEDVIFVSRNDWQYGGGLSASYRQSTNLTVGVSAGYQKRDSTFFLSEYESFEASLLFSARLRF